MTGMVHLFREGGAGMYVLVGLGFVTLATAFWFAVQPTRELVGFVKWMCLSLAFATLTSMIYDVATVCHAVASDQMPAALRPAILCQGISESCAPGILGGAFLALVAMLAAVGQRRLDARRA